MEEIKTKVLLVAPRYNADTGNSVNYNYAFPLGLAYISAVLKKEGYEVDCLNINHYNGKIRNLINITLNKKKYDFVGTGGTALQYSCLNEIIESSKKHVSNPTVILGGSILTASPKLMFGLLRPHLGVIGEGEVTLIELLECIRKKKSLNNVNGIIYTDSEKILLTEARKPVEKLNSLPYPDFDGLEFAKKIENARCNDSYYHSYIDFPQEYSVLGSRGCPFNCTFCWHYARYRAREMKDLLEEIDSAVEKYSINCITLYDDCFSANKQRIYEFCSGMKLISEKYKKKIGWTCQLLVNSVDESILKVMKEAGCEVISYGFESFSQKVLASMKKPITPKQIEEAFRLTIQTKMGVQANFIFGDIAETTETAKETLEFWKRNCMGQVNLGFIIPYPGSYIYEYCKRKGIIKDEEKYILNKMPYLNSRNGLNFTEGMNSKEFHKLADEINKYYSKYTLFVVPTNVKNKNNLLEINIKCPFCKKSSNYENCSLKSRFDYEFVVLCKNCRMKITSVSLYKNIIYKNYFYLKKVQKEFNKLKKLFFGSFEYRK